MVIVWDGKVQTEILDPRDLQVRHGLADAAKNYDWPHVFKILHKHPELVNTTRPGGSSLYAPLHQAAHGGAPPEVLRKLIEIGAWRTLQNARGERPVDVAEKKRHSKLLGVLAPALKRDVPLGVLLKVQSHFHAVIRGRAEKEIQQHGLRLPELESLLEIERGPIWFEVPGMAGGFAYDLVADGVEAKLESKSWCRMVDGSGERHEITSAGSKLVEEGFV
jgi:hypothetical protein